MDSISHPVPKMPWLPLVLNFLWPGLGTAVDGCYGPSGLDIKVLALGIIISWLYVVAWLWWFFLLPLVLALVLWAFGLYHGYIIYKKS